MNGPGPKLLSSNVSRAAKHAMWEAEELRNAEVFGGIYKLCWCSAKSACLLAKDFQTDVGNLMLLGPVPYGQDKTCISGLTCVLDGIAMYGTLQANSLAIMETCGQLGGGNVLDSNQIVLSSFQSEPYMSSAYVQLGLLSTQGGRYRLCWCGSDCQRLDQFTVDFGQLDLIGPNPLQQDRSCFSGQRCELSDLTGHLLSDSLVLVLDTCGSTDAIERGPLRSSEIALSSASGAYVLWDGTGGTGSISSSPGGQYRLCWCGPSAFSQFSQLGTTSFALSVCSWAVDLGRLTLLGPGPLYQHRTCVSGRSCALDGISGEGAANGHIWALETCGNVKQTGNEQSVRSFPSAFERFSTSWITDATSAGQYRLCWCAETSSNLTDVSCQFPTDFVTDFGSLLVIGVSPFEQKHSCISGQHCFVGGIRGFSLSASDQVVLQETCGLPSHWQVGTLEAYGSAYGSYGTTLSMTWSPMTVPGGEYRLCWCHGINGSVEIAAADGLEVWDPVTNTSSSSSSVQRFSLSCATLETSVDFGSLTSIGPSPFFQDRTCKAGEICRIAEIHGTSLQPGDWLQVLETCGFISESNMSFEHLPVVPLVPFGFPNGGLLEAEANDTNTSLTTQPSRYTSLSFSSMGIVSSLGGEYRLCWCSAQADCNLNTAFRLDIGQLTILGASAILRDFTCTSGRSCDLEMQVPLPEDGTFAILDTCGTKGLRMENPIFPVTGATWSFGPLIVPGGRYRLCWCSFALMDSTSNDSNVSLTTSAGCHDALDYRIDSGTLHMIGPEFFQERTCVAGQQCGIESLVGYGLSDLDSLLIMDTCASKFPQGFPDWCCLAILVHCLHWFSGNKKNITKSFSESRTPHCSFLAFLVAIPWHVSMSVLNMIR